MKSRKKHLVTWVCPKYPEVLVMMIIRALSHSVGDRALRAMMLQEHVESLVSLSCVPLRTVTQTAWWIEGQLDWIACHLWRLPVP